MKKARAAAAAIVGLALTATGVLAATPKTAQPSGASSISTVAQDKTAVGGSHDNHGGAVSAAAHAAHDGTMSTGTTTNTVSPATAPTDNHGAAVSAVAQDKTAVGGPNDNHGGAVSTVARGSHGAAGTHGHGATTGTTGGAH